MVLRLDIAGAAGQRGLLLRKHRVMLVQHVLEDAGLALALFNDSQSVFRLVQGCGLTLSLSLCLLLLDSQVCKASLLLLLQSMLLSQFSLAAFVGLALAMHTVLMA